MRKIAEDTYQTDDNEIVVLAPGSYDPNDPTSVETKITEVLNEAKNPPPPKREEIIARRALLIDDIRNKKIAQGVSYTFPDGITGTVQIRNVIDQMNITGLGTAALGRKSRSRTDPFSFIDAENVKHVMTPDQMIDLGLAVQEFVSSFTEKGRIKKDELVASLDPETYDIEAGW